MPSASFPSDLLPAKVQKARVDDEVCALEVFAGRKRFVVVRPGSVVVVDDRPAGPSDQERRDPPALQGLVRKELVPAILSAVDVDEARGLVRLTFARKEHPARVVVVEPDARAPRWLLLAPSPDGERILACVPGPRAQDPANDGRDLRRGRLYEPPRRAPAPAPLSSTHASIPSAAGGAPPRVREVRARLKAEIERLRRLVRALEGDRRKHGDPARLEEDGELLKTALGRVHRGLDAIDVVGFDGAPRTLPLDPSRDGKGNLQALFARAKKARAALLHTEPRLREARERLARLESLREAVLVPAPTDESLQRAEDALNETPRTVAPSARRAAAKGGRRKPWRCFAIPIEDAEGAPVVLVRVGRGAKDNDALVKSARGNDLWLHARDKVGAHVVVPSSGGPVPDGLVRDAALLAAHFSSARGERHVDVQQTRVKHLKKPGAGAPAGLFLVGHETVLHVRVDDDRVAELLRREVPAS